MKLKLVEKLLYMQIIFFFKATKLRLKQMDFQIDFTKLNNQDQVAQQDISKLKQHKSNQKFND